jgi:biotin synthase-like enzyme|tara:strand:- start:780 stop:1646 length:867 start_codon:yes stop_codon:yes gene_type:complete
MSTQKSLISDPKKAKRSMASILAEAYLCKKLGWKIGFLSAGYGNYTQKSILELCKNVYEISNQKLWLNIGVLNEKTIEPLVPYLEGICGAVETTNEKVHKKTAPNKPIAPIENMYKICDKYNLKKSMTFIVGLGETIDDFDSFKAFLIKNKINKIIFYALNPIKGTVFEKSKGPEINYYLQWIKKTRKTFPKLNIVAAPWVNRVDYIHLMLNAGADAITKFPAIKLFNTIHAKNIEKEIKSSNYEMQGTFTKIPEINSNEIKNLSFDNGLKEDIIKKINGYLKIMKRN